MERKHGVRPMRRLYRCIACDVRLTSLSARHDCPGSYHERALSSMTVLPEFLQLRALLDPAYHGAACARGIRSLCTFFAAPTAAYGDFLLVNPTSWRHVFQIDVTLEYRLGLLPFSNRFSVGVTLWGTYHAKQFTSHYPVPVLRRLGNRLWTRTPPSMPPDTGPLSTTGEVSSKPGMSCRRHTGPGSTSSASRASSWMSTEPADVPGTDYSDDVSAK
ncbi:hypothetical protein MRX96_025878 [Rhipicephalus microplus]